MEVEMAVAVRVRTCALRLLTRALRRARRRRRLLGRLDRLFGGRFGLLLGGTRLVRGRVGVGVRVGVRVRVRVRVGVRVGRPRLLALHRRLRRLS